MNVSDIIKRSGLNDNRIAIACGMHRATIGRYRKGILQPDTPQAVMALSRALGVDPAAIRPDWAAVFRE